MTAGPATAQAHEAAPMRRNPFHAVEDTLSIAVLLAMAALPVVEAASRVFAGRGIAGVIPIVEHLTLWSAMLGAALTARSDRMLALATATFLHERLRARVRVFTSVAGAAVVGALLAASIHLVSVQRAENAVLAWGIPLSAAMVVMPVALALIAGRMVLHASGAAKGRVLVALGLLIPLALAFVPEPARASLRVPLLIVLGAATAFGMPIFAALAGSAALLFWSQGSPITSIAYDAYRLSAHPILPAIPLFTLGGYVLAQGGASQRLLRLCSALLGWMPGGLAIVTTLVLAFFTPLTGASGITILSMGGVLLPMLTSARYPERTSIGLVTVSGSIGLLLPPSLPVILYAVTAQQGVDKMFYAGLLPGFLLIAVVATWAAFRGWSAGAERTPFVFAEALRAAWAAKWELFLPVLVLGSYFGGSGTLVETAAFALVYAIVVGCLIHRELKLPDLRAASIESATLAGGFLIILATALAFTNYLIDAEIPMRALEWVKTHIDSPLVFLLALNVFLVLVGAVMDIYSAIFVIAPLIAPMGAAYGIDPVHLGIVFLANMELGYLMPPMGENLFLSAYRFNQPLWRICRSAMPYVLILLAAVLVITYVPALTVGFAP